MRISVLKILLIYCLVSLVAPASFSDPIDPDTARFVGLAHIKAQNESARHRTSLAPPKWDSRIAGVRVLRDSQGKELAYIVDLSPGGFVAVSVDTDIRPVIAYSFNGEFPMEDTGQNTPLHLLKRDMTNRIEALSTVPEYIRLENNGLWKQYLNNNVALLAQNTEQWPPDKDTGWLDTTWGQSDFYNDSCPDDPNTVAGIRYDGNGEYIGGTEDGRCLTGCTATAMGQIVNYWQYPPSINFTSSDDYISSCDPDDGFGERVIHISASEASMSSIDYSDGNPSESTIADLLLACGIAFNTLYSDNVSSGAFTAMPYHRFDYASAARIPGDDVSFYGILKDNMKNAHPAQLGIAECADCEGGHSIVADGYRVNDAGEYYHLNFGWSGEIPDAISECWYSLPDGMPDDYNFVDSGIVNISPSLGPSRDWYVSLDGNDYNDGNSWESAKRNIQSAINAAMPGDVIKVAAGTYYESIWLHGGITLLGDGAETTRIEYNGDYPVIYSDQVRDAEISGFTIAYTGSSKNPTIVLINSSIIIAHNVITGSTMSGIIAMDRSDPQIIGNEIRNNKQNGIYVYSESSGIISGNVISGNGYQGIEVRDKSDLHITYNTIVGNNDAGILAWLDSTPVISNNIIVKNGIYGIDTTHLIWNGYPMVSFNDVWGNDWGDYSGIDKPATDISVDPLFVDSANGDYHLQQDSLCRGASENGSDLGAYSLQTSPGRILSISSTEVYPGDTASVWITVSNTRGIADGKIVVKYDPNLITVAEIINLLPDISITANKDVSGEIQLAIADARNMPAGSGALVSIEMMANAYARVGAETALSFSEAELYDEAGDAIPVDLENGTVKISGRKGDVSKDGSILPDDAILTLQITVLLIEPTVYQAWAADMNGDDEVGADDAILILQETIASAPPGAILAADLNGITTIELAQSRRTGSAGILPASLENGRVTVPLKMDNAGGLAGGDIRIAYNSAALRPVDVSSESDMVMAGNTSEPGILRIAFARNNSLSIQTVIEMQFDIIGDDLPWLEIENTQLYRADASIIAAKLVDHQISFLSMLPENYALLQNFPNPFNPETWIPYQLAEDTNVVIKIYAATGQIVRTLNLGHKPAGFYISKATAAHWDGRNETGEPVASGVYFVVLRVGEYQHVRRIVLLK